MHGGNVINEKDVTELRANFLGAGPFPHVVLDDFLTQENFAALSQEMAKYYEENKDKGKSWNTVVESGKWGSTGLNVPPMIKALDDYLKSDGFLQFLSTVTGFNNLKVTTNINGVGFSFFHAMKPGAYLGPHTDHTRDLNRGPYHVLNIIIYTGTHWDPNWGGGTTLFDKNLNLKSDIEYKPNRALIFMHSPESIHGTQRISQAATGLRFSVYYDYYTHDADPYQHVGRSDFKLIDSPHLFYLPTPLSYLKKENRRYLRMHLSHRKNLFLARFKK